MTDPILVPLIIGVFILAGLVKGVIGLGLPTVALSLMTVVTDLPTAMALMLVPTFATNVLQALTGGHALEVLRRIWLFLLLATGMVWLGGLVLEGADLTLMSAMLGVVLVAYALLGFSGYQMKTPARREQAFGIVFGAVNGVLTGMVGSYAVPGVMYLQSLGFNRNQFVQAMGMLFLGSTIALALTLSGNNLMTSDMGLTSLWATAPAFLGFFAGQAIRKRLSESLFRKLFYAGLLILGLFIVVRPFFSG
ncbi:sulfite exporter TauE/SafE family protein [uncultured Roseibium sp.]|uniref:sulfite exporter TauE/SafE family protein n=1 Tax=uncultured Roseibium sp. TaxID=1936171 RepID=UPI0025950536|nr:sulfite exporter TauE/SafE family protein [uncultured Roseibium sp.]